MAFVRIERAELRELRDDLLGAGEDLEQACRWGPRSTLTALGMASFRRRHGDPHAALADAARGLELEPDHPGLLLERAACLAALSDWARAQEAAERALAGRPGLVLAEGVRALALIMQDQADVAEAALSAALERDPSAAQLWRLRAHARRVRGDTRGELQDLREALARTPHGDPQHEAVEGEIRALTR